MKKLITVLLFIAAHKMTMAQNVGIGTTEPANKLHIVGSLLVNTPTTATSTAPTGVHQLSRFCPGEFYCYTGIGKKNTKN